MGNNRATAVMALSFTAGIVFIIFALLLGMYWFNEVEILVTGYLWSISYVWYVSGVQGFALLRTTIDIMLLMVGSGGALIGAGAMVGVMSHRREGA
jgi:hypothetical protein